MPQGSDRFYNCVCMKPASWISNDEKCFHSIRNDAFMDFNWISQGSDWFYNCIYGWFLKPFILYLIQGYSNKWTSNILNTSSLPSKSLQYLEMGQNCARRVFCFSPFPPNQTLCWWHFVVYIARSRAWVFLGYFNYHHSFFISKIFPAEFLEV